jgi:hypothetical protein
MDGQDEQEQPTTDTPRLSLVQLDKRVTALEDAATSAAPAASDVVNDDARIAALEDALAQLRADVSKRVAHLGHS